MCPLERNMKVIQFCIGMTALVLLSVDLHGVPIEKEGDFNSTLEQTSQEEKQFDDNIKVIFCFWDNSDDDKDAADGVDKDGGSDRYDKDFED
ncbi:hypothetical protein ECG_09448 [Echinococcus granulosus]|nr:hypothetical protein ECG_09448 [Echinococcus granulosus]